MSLRDKVASLKIAPKEFTVPTQDHHGHSARIGFRLPPGMLTEISVVMRHGQDFGWQTDADFYRWATRYGLDYLGSVIQDDRLANMRNINQQLREMYAEQKEYAELDGVIDEGRKMTAFLTQKGGGEKVIPLLKAMRTRLSSCNDAFWRERWLAQFDREFGHFFRTASLVDTDENE